jgi:hypothetical protein
MAMVAFQVKQSENKQDNSSMSEIDFLPIPVQFFRDE